MKRSLDARFLKVVICGLLVASPVMAADDLGMIHVESTTIDDRFEHKRDEPSNTQTISGELVDDSHIENLQQILQSVPGVTAESTGGDRIKIHIRGVETQTYRGEKPGVAVVIDGVPVFERTGSVNIDIDNIESIKVIKGGASYLFGDDALSGAVIITTKRGAKQAGYRLATERGSFNYQKYLARAGIANDNMSGHVQVSRRKSDGYWFQSEYLADYLNGKLQWYIDDSSDLSFGFEASQRDKDSHGTVSGVTQAQLDPTSIEGRDYSRMYDVELAKYYITYAKDLDAKSNYLFNIYQFSDHTRFVDAPQNYDINGRPVTDVDAYINDNDYKQIQRGIKSEYRRAGTNLAWMAAVDLRENGYESNSKYLVDFVSRPGPGAVKNYAGTVTDDNKTREHVQAVYGEIKFQPAQRLTFTVNGRYDHIALDYDDYLNSLKLDKSFDVTSWRFGTNYALAETADIYGNISTGFRAPTIKQLFAGTISPTGKTDSNPDLRAEKSLNLELGLRGKVNFADMAWDYDAAVFQLDYKDYIMSSAGLYSQAVGGAKDQYQNIGGTRSRGIELGINSDRTRRVSINLAYSYLQAEFTSYDNYNLVLGNAYAPYIPSCTGLVPARGHCIQSMNLTGNVVPRTPEHHLNMSVDFRPAQGWTMTGEMDAYSSYYADETNYVKIDARTVFNALLRYDTSFGKINKAAVFLRVDNVFNKDYYNAARGSGDSNNDGVVDAEDISYSVNPGRVWTAGLTMQF